MTSPSSQLMDATKPQHAAESGHWYTRQGDPAYKIVGSNGKDRDTTLRDARKLNLLPSVTGIVRMAAAPGLEAWKQTQVMLASLTLPRRPHEPEQEWISRVWADSREQASKAAERGTIAHAAIQRYYEGLPVDEQWREVALGVHAAVAQHFPVAKWECEKSFAHHLGYGGKVDLHVSEPPGIVLDIKTKEFEDPDKLATFDEHHMQLAAYAQGLGMPLARCGIIYASMTKPGIARVLMLDDDERERGWRMFTALLAYWKAKNKYDSVF